MLDFLAAVPPQTWWSISAFVHAIFRQHPGFQRPANDFDSWYLRDAQSGDYLRGIEHWEAVDGALLRYLLSKPLRHLGLLQIALPAEGDHPAAFRWSPWAGDLLRGRPPEGLPEEHGRLSAVSNGRVFAPQGVPRAVRYQIARFCTWEGAKAAAYAYRITPQSLERARRQGLTVRHLLQLLARHAEQVPPALRRALQQWARRGTEARLQRAVILRVRSPELLEKIRKSKAARFLGEPLGPTSVLVREGAEEKVLEILAALGYLGEAT